MLLQFKGLLFILKIHKYIFREIKLFEKKIYIEICTMIKLIIETLEQEEFQ